MEYEWIANGQSVFLIALVLLHAGTLNGDEHVILIGGHQNFLVFSLDSEEGEVVCWIQVSNHAARLLGEQGYVFGVVVAYVKAWLLSFLLSSKVVRTMPPL